MPKKTVQVDQMAKAVNDALREYGVAADAAVDEAVRLTAAEAVKDIRGGAQNLFEGTGAYASSWTQKTQKRRKGYGRIVYSRSPYYRLTHLLEHGHAKVGGGYVDGRPHIAPAANAAAGRLVNHIKDLMRRG